MKFPKNCIAICLNLQTVSIVHGGAKGFLVFMNSAVKKVWNIISGVLVAAVVVLAALLVGVRLLGFQVYAVLSGSMEPNYPVGSLVYVKSASSDEIEVGDAITFVVESGTKITHRVTECTEENGEVSYKTKGDANETEDAGLVSYQNVVGKVHFSIPYLGYLSSFIQTVSGRYVTIAAVAVLLIICFIPDLFAKSKK